MGRCSSRLLDAAGAERFPIARRPRAQLTVAPPMYASGAGATTPGMWAPSNAARRGDFLRRAAAAMIQRRGRMAVTMRRTLFLLAAFLLASGNSPATAGHWRAHY